MEKWVDISGISIPSDENDYYELVEFADAIAELEPIYMESVQTEAYNRGIDSERKRIAESWCKAEYERGYKDGRESADRPQGKWIYCENEYGIDGYRCSNCGKHIAWDYQHKFINFIDDYHTCPFCDARMKGADDGSC